VRGGYAVVGLGDRSTRDADTGAQPDLDVRQRVVADMQAPTARHIALDQHALEQTLPLVHADARRRHDVDAVDVDPNPRQQGAQLIGRQVRIAHEAHGDAERACRVQQGERGGMWS
jgi:hypothetical protein